MPYAFQTVDWEVFVHAHMPPRRPRFSFHHDPMGGNELLAQLPAATKPKPAELQLILEAAGGALLGKAPAADGAASSAHGKTIVVSTEAEKKAWAPLAKLKGVSVIRAEHLLTCVLRQELVIGARQK